MKKIGKYIALTFLLLFGLVCVGVLYLFFVPNSSLFNITYINLGDTIKSGSYEISDIEEIALNSRAYEVEVLPSEDDTISVEVDARTFGLVLVKNKNVQISTSVKNQTLTFTVSEPFGFSANLSSKIKLYIPNEYTKALRLSNKKSLTTIADENINISNLSYSSTDGDLNLNELTITGDLNLDLNKSTCHIDSSVQTNSNVNLKMTSGKFLATESVLGEINILKSTRGVVNVKECKNINGSETSSGGQIIATKVGHINVHASDTKIKISEVTDGATINLLKSGTVSIEKIYAYSSISTNSGKISIGESTSHVTLYSDEGNITIAKAKESVSTKTNYGEINVTFHKPEAEETVSENLGLLNAVIHNGKLTATGVRQLGLTNEEITKHPEVPQGIFVTGKGRVHLEMDDVKGTNKIEGKNGNMKIIINSDAQYKLTTNPETPALGSVRVNLMQIVDYKGYRTKSAVTTYVNCSESNYQNTLTVSTLNGDLTILDTALLDF